MLLMNRIRALIRRGSRLLWWLNDKESTCNAGDTGEAGSIPGLGRSPGEGHGNPLQYFCLENPHEQKSPVSYSPWGYKELDTTEQLSAHPYWSLISWHAAVHAGAKSQIQLTYSTPITCIK